MKTISGGVTAPIGFEPPESIAASKKKEATRPGPARVGPGRSHVAGVLRRITLSPRRSSSIDCI